MTGKRENTGGAARVQNTASGLVVVDKPKGWTSHDVVGRMRRLAGTRKVGHAGTLDPMATGVLVVGVNKATRLLTYIVGVDKTYEATIRLGQSTVTDDAEGELVQQRIAAAVTEESVAAAVGKLTGDIMQVPSAVSAIKVAGERSYARVRKGENVELEARPVTVGRFDVHEVRRLQGGKIIDVDATVECSSGTYIRALARDLGEDLGVGGHLTALRRTRVGPYALDVARTMEELADEFGMLDLDTAARALFPNRQLTDHEAAELSFGRRIDPNESDEIVAAVAPGGTVVALLKNKGEAARPEIVFAAS
ncbi:tRNA pseudouridine(55) synthase TruB [Zhihengliuella salsuginis]|uniref:tRNA pseudouridine synthase B n=1 Tax=Zhihengliuella salsuginis TaxID=578222 RepID=A0ABQ3GI80_9MICC|nr:tRNA pseudouridine(55) synthase TruB [Zhihengliuella salsuginis]GHD07453.1 tRNA pseudouridine synthase B [Zhihengliuella salsuginis]